MQVLKLNALRPFLISLASILLPILVTAQSIQKVDSLLLELDNVSGRQRIDVLIEIAENYRPISPIENRKYGNMALVEAKALDYDEGIVLAYNRIGTSFKQAGIFDSADMYYDSALQMAYEMRSLSYQAENYRQKGVNASLATDYAMAIGYLLEARRITDKMNNDDLSCLILNNMGQCFMSMNDYNRAYSMAIKSMELNANRFKIRNVSSYIILGRIHNELYSNDSAVFYYNKALENSPKYEYHYITILRKLGEHYHHRNELDKSLEVFRKALYYSDSIQTNVLSANIQSNIAFHFQEMGEYDKAIEYDRKAYRLRKKSGQVMVTGSSLSNIAKSYLKANEPDSCFYYVNEALRVQQKAKRLEFLIFDYNILADYYLALELPDSAVEVQRIVKAYEDTLVIERSSKQVREMLYVEELDRYNREKAEYEAVAKYKTRTLMVLLAFLFIVILSLLFFYKNRESRKINKQLSTQNKLLEKALKQARDNEKKMSAMFQNANVGVAIMDGKGIINYVNDTVARLLQYSSEEMLSMNVDQLTKPEDLDASHNRLESILNREAANTKAEREFVRKDGSLLWANVSASAVFNDQDELDYIVAILVDVTEQKEMEQALIESEKRASALADSTFEAIFFSENGYCMEANQAAYDMFGFSDGELIGIFGTEIIAPESRELVKKNMLSGYTKPYEAMAQRKDGSYFIAEFEGKQINYQGKDIRVTAVRDISVRKEVENEIETLKQQLFRSQLNPHFIFNALVAIQNYIQKRDPHSAAKYLSSFAKLIRYTLSNSRKNFVSFDQEIKAIENYMDLQRLRMNDLFDYQINLDPALEPEALLIPPLISQPFIENAIEHGLKHKKDHGHIIIDFKFVERSLICTVTDDGVGRKKSSEIYQQSERLKKSMGISITKNRLDSFTNRTYTEKTFEIRDLKDKDGKACGTQVVFSIPYETAY